MTLPPQVLTLVGCPLSGLRHSVHEVRILPADLCCCSDLSIDFTANAYAQVMQDRLLVFKPAVVARRESLFLTESTRKHPILLESRAFNETVRFKLPTGFEIEELPEPVTLELPFGSYRATYEMKNGELVFTRALSQRAGSIPAEHYQTVRIFYERIRAAEQPVVLARK